MSKFGPITNIILWTILLVMLGVSIIIISIIIMSVADFKFNCQNNDECMVSLYLLPGFFRIPIPFYPKGEFITSFMRVLMALTTLFIMLSGTLILMIVAMSLTFCIFYIFYFPIMQIRKSCNDL